MKYIVEEDSTGLVDGYYSEKDFAIRVAEDMGDYYGGTFTVRAVCHDSPYIPDVVLIATYR